MSSLDNHTMVPTLTIFGRFSECTRWVIADPEVPTALVTDRSMTLRRKRRPLGSTIGASLGSSSRDRAANALVAWSEYAGAMAATHKSRPWFLRIFGTKIPTPLDAGRSDLVVVAEGFDDAEASSTALERAASTEPEFMAESEVVLRHHLDLPEDSVADAESIVAQDGYVRGVSRPRTWLRRSRIRFASSSSGSRCSTRCIAPRSVHEWPVWRSGSVVRSPGGTRSSPRFSRRRRPNAVAESPERPYSVSSLPH